MDTPPTPTYKIEEHNHRRKPPGKPGRFLFFYQEAENMQKETRPTKPEKRKQQEPRKCSYPTCKDHAKYGSYCWFHFQEERYTSR